MLNSRDQQVEEAEQLARRMRVLKWVVLILGVLLVIAMIVTVAGIIYKSRHAVVGSSEAGLPVADIQAAGLSAKDFVANGFGIASLPLQPECHVANATASGDRLIIVVTGPTENCRIIMIGDLKSGKLLGQIGFHPPSP